jgi:hypothetical protein
MPGNRSLTVNLLQLRARKDVMRDGGPEDNDSPGFRLLYRAADLREHTVGIRTDETDRAHDNDENYRQHDRVFRNVLATLIVPELL